MVTHTCNLSYSGGGSWRIVSLRPALSQKQNETEGLGAYITQVVEHMKSWVQSPYLKKKKERKKKGRPNKEKIKIQNTVSLFFFFIFFF
jgi:hypothetical protein